VTVGIIACVEVTTTTIGTSPKTTGRPLSTTTSSIRMITSSGTTIVPTSVQTTTRCKRDMAQVGSVYVSSVTSSIEPLGGRITNNVDLTNSETVNGVTFPSVPDTSGLFDKNNKPLYEITFTFNPAGVDSLSSIIVNKETNVNQFVVEFFTPSNLNQPFTISPNTPLSYTSTIIDSRASIMNFLSDVPSPLSGIRISILSTTNNQPPTNLKLFIVGCFYPPIEEEGIVGLAVLTTTTPVGTSISTRIPSITTTGLPPTTTTMNYCIEEKGMNEPLNIKPNQVILNPSPEQTTPPGDINPTLTTPGLNFPPLTMNPEINITLDQPATLTLIYVPVDRPNQPSNVNEFTVQFFYPNNTNSILFTSIIPSIPETTTTTTTGIPSPSGIPLETTTTTPSRLVPPSNISPQVDLTPNFRVPENTIIVIKITLTEDQSSPKNVTVGVLACIVPTTLVSSSIISTTPLAPPFVAIERVATTGPSLFTTVTPVLTTAVQCIYSNWTVWTVCTVTCGEGTQTRARNIVAGFCTEPLSETRICRMEPCPCIFTRDIYISTFQEAPPLNNVVGWIEKDDQIGYTNVTEAVHIGDHLDNNTIIHSHNCNEFICKDSSLVSIPDRNCSRDCQFEPWSNWTSCSVTCGGDGIQTRSRGKIPAVGDGKDCVGPETESQPCTSPPCIGACLTTDWTDFTPCSKSCGLGSQLRTRSFISQQPNCTDSLIEVRDCNIGCCPVDGSWSPWSQWSNCTADCNGGERTRTRQCNQPAPECNGASCEEPSTQSESCNTQPCTGDTCTDGKVLSNCSNSCNTSCSTLTCNEQCSEPELCQIGCICANGTVMDANGNCVVPSTCQCTYEGRILLPGQTINVADKCQECTCQNGCVTCKTVPCVEQCTYSDWSPFGECSAPCNGTQSRYQTLQGPNCYRNDTRIETRPCSTATTSYPKGCSTCTCLNTTEEQCVTNCAITNETCSQIEDPLFTYTYAPPTDGSCCGSCVKVSKPEICSVQQLPAEFITIDNCISTALIPQQQCLGGCISYSMSGFNSPRNNCRCCSPATTSTILVDMTCTDPNGGITIISKPYENILTCSCSACENTIGGE
ncbi:unnamed protein product, partial [Rotaria sordida]